MFTLKCSIVLVVVVQLVWPALCQPISVEPDDDPMETAESERSPMLYSSNFDMFVPYMDHQAAGSMHFQNFEKFVDSQMPANRELDMNESKFLSSVPLRAPKELSAEERRIRSVVQEGDPTEERRVQRNFAKGSGSPVKTGHMWENFDYDSHLA